MSVPFAIAAGAAIGALLRHYFSHFVMIVMGTSFPWGTLFVNVLGSAVLGFLVAWFAQKGGISTDVRAFLVVGALGSFTTFSAFSLEATLLLERGAYALSGAYIAGSVLLSIGGLMAGLFIGRQLTAVF